MLRKISESTRKTARWKIILLIVSLAVLLMVAIPAVQDAQRRAADEVYFREARCTETYAHNSPEWHNCLQAPPTPPSISP